VAGKAASAWAWTRTQVTPRRATGAAVVVLFGIGLAFFATASDGRKQVDLGSSIFGGLIVGLAVILAERHYTRTVEVQREDARSLAPTMPAEPAQDDPSRPSGERRPEPPAPAPGRYTVRFDTRERVRHRADAFQARLRLTGSRNTCSSSPPSHRAV
jgi:hypothetical protein